jgi:site-specific DNA-cytosine methylase
MDNQQSVARKSSFGHYEMTEQAATLKSSGGDIGGGSENLAMTGYQTRADEKNGNFTIAEAEVANSLSALWPGDTSHRSMTLVQAVIQDSREMANKTQNGLGVSTEDISYTLTSIDRPAVFRKSSRAQTNEDSETWVEGDVANTLNSFDVGDVRTTHAIIGTSYDGFNQKVEPDGAHRTIRIGRDSSDFVIAPGGVDDDSLLPAGLDSHRYRCCGNGVVAPVAEWIGRRIVEVDRRWREEGK